MFARLERHSTRARLAGFAALFLALWALPAAAQRRPSGAEVWAANCGRCHRPRAVDAYNAWQWESVITHMALTARLTPGETKAVRQFLVGAARGRQGAPGSAVARPRAEPVLVATTAGALFFSAERCCDLAVGKSLYDAQCVACHGKSGKGDGPAAVALNPRPANLTNAPRLSTFTDDSLATIVANGGNGMPAFGNILSPEQVREIVAYVRTLIP